ncbi:MAG: hypothetical protein AAFP17_02615 [Pseudomonadota bacterium]
MPNPFWTPALRASVVPFTLALALPFAAQAAEAGCSGGAEGLGRAACLGSAAETAMLDAPLALGSPVRRVAAPPAVRAVTPTLPIAADLGRPLPVADVAVVRREVRNVSVPEAPRFEDGHDEMAAPRTVGAPSASYTPFLPASGSAALPVLGVPAD